MENEVFKNMGQLAEGQFGTGARIEAEDPRRILYAGTTSMEVDWDRGYCVEQKLGGKIYAKQQASSSSCVGQSWSYFSWVKQVLEMKNLTGMTLEELRKYQPETVQEHSAKAIYSQIALPGIGAYATDGAKVLIRWGIVADALVPSYRPGEYPTEEFMTDTSWKSMTSSFYADKMRSLAYAYTNPPSMNEAAHAIEHADGVVIILLGSNNGTWKTLEPKPPEGKAEWAHAIYCDTYGKDEKGEFIGTLNSWGDLGGRQKLRNDYFEKNVSLAMTLIDQPSTHTIKLYNPQVEAFNKANGIIDPNYPRLLPVNQKEQIKGFLQSGWSYKI